MIINIALWADPELFGDFGGDGRASLEPARSTASSSSIGRSIDGLPAWPLFETLVGLLLVIGAIYYVVVDPRPRRGRRGRRGDRRGDHRLTPEPPEEERRGERSPRRVMTASRPTDESCAVSCATTWSGRCSACPELAGRELT